MATELRTRAPLLRSVPLNKQKYTVGWVSRLTEVALLLAAFPGSGEVEQNFSHLEMYSAHRKSSTSTAHLRRLTARHWAWLHDLKKSHLICQACCRSMLRVRLDGLPPHLYVRTPTLPHGELQFEPSMDAHETQQMFLSMFGSGKNVCKAANLPRRRMSGGQETSSSTNVETGKETVAGLKTKRNAQLEVLRSTGEPVDDADQMASLDAEAQGAAASRKGADFQRLMNTLKKSAASKKRRLALGPSGERDRDYVKAVAKEDALRAEIRKLRETPSGVRPVPVSTNGALLLFDKDCDLSAVTEISLLRCVPFDNSVAQYQELLRLSPEKLFWYVDGLSEESLILPREGDANISAFMVASRILGGFIATDEWMKACAASREVLRPTLSLSSAANVSMEQPGVFSSQGFRMGVK